MVRFTVVLMFAFLCWPAFCGIISIEDNLDKEAKIDLVGYPAEIKALYPLFVQRCSKCHALSRPINSGFNRQKFKDYIGKMRRKLNSGINTDDAVKIYTFLGYYSENRK